MHRLRSWRFPSFLPVLLFLVVSAGPSGASAQQSLEAPRPLRLEDYYDLTRLGSLAVSPDGATVVYERSSIDREADAWKTSLASVSAAGEGLRTLVADASSPQFSPDGRWLAFLRGQDGPAQVWLLPLDGGEPWRLTGLPGGVSDFAWGPDSRRLVVVSSDPRAEPPAILPEADDEAEVDTPTGDAGAAPELAGAWQPEAPRLPEEEAAEGGDGSEAPETPALSLQPVDPGSRETPRSLPWIVTRLQFKQDGVGYLSTRRDHLWLVALPEERRAVAAERLTSGPWDDSSPAWSPDGRWIAFVSNRTAHPDANDNADVWIVSPEGGEPIAMTRAPGADGSPTWSPDGRWIAYVHTPVDPPVYANSRLRLVTPYAGEAADSPDTTSPVPSEPYALTDHLDRPLAGSPRWMPDGTGVLVALQDRGTVALVRVGTGLAPMDEDDRGGLRRLFGGSRDGDPEDRARVYPLLTGPRVVGAYAPSPDGEELFVTLTSGTEPEELYRLDTVAQEDARVPMDSSNDHVQGTRHPPGAALTSLTAENSGWRQRVQLSSPEPIRFASADDVFVEGWLLRPPNLADAVGIPLVVRIHGGPVSQYTWAFSWELQYLAARGYAVMYVNPRGSSGYGQEFAHALWADWGGPDFADVMAGIDHLVDRGVVDESRIGVGGWSYGGILTNYMITGSDRFAAAISGASETDYFACYGTDDLQRWWENELGLPYEPEARERYDRLSPIHRVARIETPTLFMVGEKDWRVPLSQSEQMYTQLRRRQIDGGPPTGLVVYPDESHGISRPSFQIDRWRRYVAWYDRHVKGDPDADPFFGERAW